MIFWYLLITAPSPIHANSQFECGDHGRFEYCIDGIPGCIIGCHCHPGYYFDTDTKICEPNSKLSRTYRRQKSAEPTRIYHANSFEVLESSTFSPSPNNMDDHVDSIAKNTDDLGDWLYNQFFKTIEKQIINHTDTKVMTRRSGKSPVVKATKKKYHKVKKGSAKRKQRDDLRRKLLRITENDSLFDSDTDADEDADADTDDDSSHSSSSDETRESKDKDKEHGHKKFVIVNKKPKPPLPSFIFLPNIDTPFYPPVGLPPPVLPMYPMVPVPPVLPAPYVPMPPDCDPMETTTNGATTLSSTPQATISSLLTESAISISTTETSTTPTSNSETNAPSTDVDTSTTASRKRLRKRKQIRDKNEILRRLRELVQKAAPKSEQQRITLMPGQNPFNIVDKESADAIDEFPIKTSNDDEMQFRANYKTHAVQQQDTPNFKYLSELIHHLNESKKNIVTVQPSLQRLKTIFDLQRNKRIMNPRPKTVEPSRRFNYQLYNTEEPNPETEFYTNLGKQIASLIRGVDTKYERQIDIEIEHMNRNIPNPPIYSELNYPSNSYWERFARSPVNDVRPDGEKMDFSNKSNEALYHLENIVEMAASTPARMSLVELENVVNVIEKPLQDMQKVAGPSKIKNSHNTLNINLWPQLPTIEHLKQLINNSTEETSESYATSDVKPTPSTKILNVPHVKNKTNINSSIKIQNYTINRRSYDIPQKKFFSHEEIPYFKLKEPAKLNMMPNRRSNVQFATLSPLFDYNAKMNFYHVNREHPMYNKAPLTTPHSYFHSELHPFGFME